MKKILSLLALLMLCITGANAEKVIYEWPGGDQANKITLADGVTLQITGNESKNIQSASKITIDEAQYVSMKVSNGAQNTLTLPKKAKGITFYSYANVNHDKEGLRDCYWKEVAGVTYDAETSGGLMSCFKDGDLTNPDVRSYTFESPLDVITFTNAGEQLCYVMEVEYVEEGAEATYTVAGNSVAIFGTEWDPANAANDMVKGDDGIYTKTYEGVELTNNYVVEYKVVENHSWDVSYGDNGNNANYKVWEGDGKYNVTFTFDPETKAVACNMQKQAEVKPIIPDGAYYVMSAQEGYLINAENALDAKGALITFTFSNNAYTIEGADFFTGKQWTVAEAIEGMSGYYTISNADGFVAVSATNTLEQIADGTADAAIWILLQKSYWEDIVNSTYTVAGTKNLTGTENDWDIVNANNMELNENTGLFEKKFEGIVIESANQPEFKVVQTNVEGDKTWYPSGDNWVITTSYVGGEGIYDITITFDPSDLKEIGVTAVKTGDITTTNTYTATFKTNLAWESVYAYAWSGEGDATVEFLGSWPGTEVTDVDDSNDDYDIYKLNFQAATAPEKIIFSDGVGGKVGKTQTADLEFVDGQEYSLIYTPSALMEEAIALALDDEAVAVGKLRAAIQYAYDNDNESQLQAAIDQFKADNADQEKDETAKVKTDGWKNFNGDPAGVCATQFAPAITTYDGREAQLAEVYEQNDQAVGRTGTIIYQDITGLTNGQYKVGFYGNAFFTDGRGMTSDMADGAEDVAYVFANDEKEFITAKIATSTTENNFRQFDVEVTDGTIKLGMGKEKAGTNWHTMQIYQLTWFTTAKEVYASLKNELDAMLFAGALELDDEYMTNGKEEFQAAFDAAKAAKESNMLNIPELEAEIAKFKAAAAAFQKANYFIDFAAGEYYIIDAETDLKFAAGHNYGTRGIINEMGLDLTLTPYTESRTVTIDSRVSNGGNNHFLGQNLYMDSSEWGWALQYRGFGFYILEPNSGKYINIDSDNNLVLSGEPREFIIVDKATVMEVRLEELAEATKNAPKDATFLLQNPNFNRNDQRVEAWEWIPSGTAEDNPSNWNNHNFNGGNDVNRCAESYHAAFTVKQTVSGAPAGFYQLTAQGFYRQDDNAEENAPQFFVNGVNANVPLKTGDEGSMNAASDSFTAGNYTIDPITFEVASDGDDAGKIYVGLYTNAVHQWVIWDNFQLKYFGTEKPTTGISTVVDNNNQNNAIYNLNGQRVEKAQKGLYIINGRKQVVR